MYKYMHQNTQSRNGKQRDYNVTFDHSDDCRVSMKQSNSCRGVAGNCEIHLPSDSRESFGKEEESITSGICLCFVVDIKLA